MRIVNFKIQSFSPADFCNFKPLTRHLFSNDYKIPTLFSVILPEGTPRIVRIVLNKCHTLNLKIINEKHLKITEVFLLAIFRKTKGNTLTASEVSALWYQYMGDSMATCVYKYFLEIVEDKKIKTVLELALQLAEEHVLKIRGFLEDAHFQVPIGFTEKDVNVKAPRLFTDSFLLFYSYIMTIHGMTAYSLAITNTERKDIQNHFFTGLQTSKKLFQEIMEIAKTEPKFSSVPTIPAPQKVEFTDSTRIVADLIGDKRPLNISEISTLFFNSKKTGFIRSLSLAFSQVAEDDEVRKFMSRNVKLATKDVDSFDAILMQDHLPIPEKWDAEITDSTVSPFSDKLMMFHSGFLVNAALSYYGASLGSNLRSDIILNYNKVYYHAMQAGLLCYKIMVKRGWLEKQPEAADRKSLIEKSQH